MLTLTTPARISMPVKSSEARNDRFDVYVTDELGTKKSVFRGKVFVDLDASTVDINVSDILRNYKFEGDGIISPVWNTDHFQLPNTIDQFNSIGYYLEDVSAETDYQVSDPVLVLFQDFYPKHRVLDRDGKPIDRALLRDVTNAIPHYPAVVTNKYNFMCTNHFSENKTISLAGDNTLSLHIVPGNAGCSIPLSRLVTETGTATNITLRTGGLGGDALAKLDRCPDDYYLCWQVGGSIFSYGFKGLAESTRSYDYTMLTDMDDNANKVQTRIERGWRLNTGFIDDGYQEALDWLFRSKWVGLYDTRGDRFYYVNVKTSNFEWRENAREMKNVTLEVVERNKYIN